MPATERPLTARSVLASLLLGMHPPELSGQRLVRAGELFGQSEGTTRVALSRMVAAGELEIADGRYRLAGPLLARHARQDRSRRPPTKRWDRQWRMAVADAAGPRPAGDRAQLRKALAASRLAEWRPGLWARPDNLTAADALPLGCVGLLARLEGPSSDAELAARLWDLRGWAQRARALRADMARTIPLLERADTSALAPCFVIAAAVVRHIQADPLLPEALLPAVWPGSELRADYDSYEVTYQGLVRSWLRG